jgi:hypothetical protein
VLFLAQSNARDAMSEFVLPMPRGVTVRLGNGQTA